MSSDDLVRITDVEKKYGKTRVLGPISMTIRPGEFIGLRGPNGAGKTTLARILAGVLRPDGGSVSRSRGTRTATAYLPQELSLYETMTGGENLRFWGLAAGLPPYAIAARSRYLLERLGLADRLKSPVSDLSGGMKRRLHLATALMTTPEMLILDEPTVGADPDSAELILDTLRLFRSRGTAVVLIDHSASELAAVSDRIVTLERGLIAGEVRQ